jgi:cyclase
VLLIDTMLNQRLNKQVQELSRQLGGKPLLYAVNISSHGDHSFGNISLPTNILRDIWKTARQSG